jgi:hypothetical protein
MDCGGEVSIVTTDGNTFVPGWYPDPSGQHAWRWWDGRQWTGYASTPAHPPTPAPPTVPAASPYRAFENEHRSEPWAKRALLAYLAVIVINAAIVWATEAALQSFNHQVRYQFDNLGTHTNLTLNLPAWYRIVTGLGELVTIAGLVLFLVWQSRAAQTARLLGYPATRSPALGVGGWFIPVCNLWFPYQAIRDCLRPGHPERGMVLHMWLWLMASFVVGVVAGTLVWFGPTTASLVIGDVGAFASLVYGYFAYKTVDLIYDDHHQILYPMAPTDPGGDTLTGA